MMERRLFPTPAYKTIGFRGLYTFQVPSNFSTAMRPLENL